MLEGEIQVESTVEIAVENVDKRQSHQSSENQIVEYTMSTEQAGNTAELGEDKNEGHAIKELPTDELMDRAIGEEAKQAEEEAIEAAALAEKAAALVNYEANRSRETMSTSDIPQAAINITEALTATLKESSRAKKAAIKANSKVAQEAAAKAQTVVNTAMEEMHLGLDALTKELVFRNEMRRIAMLPNLEFPVDTSFFGVYKNFHYPFYIFALRTAWRLVRDMRILDLLDRWMNA